MVESDKTPKTALIPGGFVLKPRVIQNSWIAQAPPVVRETWDWLIMNANHAPKKYGRFNVERGQLFCSYHGIREALKWRSGKGFDQYSYGQVKRTVGVLVDNLMITKVANPRGVLVTICNYSIYQDIGSYSRPADSSVSDPTGEPLISKPRLAINKNITNKNIYTREINAAEWAPDEQTLVACRIAGFAPSAEMISTFQLKILDWKDKGFKPNIRNKFISHCKEFKYAEPGNNKPPTALDLATNFDW